ncbi:uncharacterized protein BYT42DRAFT_502410 [Radiomyces spectabilis]|uniref:uncharacterized protein n=1 Tax=Radiomyces spectabilis TaxID=64574 RepID=UPI00221FC4DD|nr:uncharacterized protein BYT42DRAFT_502410 [Radiomyces spectabilis]KAI8370580.1 hypothetical protein BYT42DRAFT_502410 [Radiomyces spectabilis]
MECYYGPTYFPGRCANHSVCAVNDDLPPYAYGATLHQWTLGDQWRSAIWAVLLTGAVATCLLVGRQQARKMVTGVHNLIEKWQNRPSPLPEQEPFVEEDAGGARQENVPQRRWWARIPGTGWIHRKLRRSQDQGAYYQLATRNAGAEEPPPYRE